MARSIINGTGSAIAIKLTKEEIDGILGEHNSAKWEKDINDYLYLRENLDRANFANIYPEYRKVFNRFYKVRLRNEWQTKFFYPLLFQCAKDSRADFAEILYALSHGTGQLQSSFASKLAATVNPHFPIIDKNVLSFLDKKLPSSSHSLDNRIAMVVELHKNMKSAFDRFLNTTTGRHLIQRFAHVHPKANISEMKMLDFVLWQSGGKKNKR